MKRRVAPMCYDAPIMRRPRIGITPDNDPDAPPPGRYRLSCRYTRAVAAGGGVPMILPQEPELAPHYLEWCDAIILTGGRDPHTEAFGEPTHAQARPVARARQAFELALLDALAREPDKPVLGICLGMQMMALHAGGRLHQHLPEIIGEDAASRHRDDNTHTVTLQHHNSILLDTPAPGRVTSCHRQAVADPGALRTVATAPDGVIEAIDVPASERRFYIGVQWHPERGPADDGSSPLNAPLIQRLVDAARATTSARSPAPPPPSAPHPPG